MMKRISRSSNELLAGNQLHFADIRPCQVSRDTQPPCSVGPFSIAGLHHRIRQCESMDGSLKAIFGRPLSVWNPMKSQVYLELPPPHFLVLSRVVSRLQVSRL